MNTPAGVGYFNRAYFVILSDLFLKIYYFSSASGDGGEA